MFKCRVILKSMFTSVALCETHRISYREWKEEDWSLRFVREGVQNKRFYYYTLYLDHNVVQISSNTDIDVY